MKLVPIGTISRLHGYKGALVAFTSTGRESVLGSLSTLWIGSSAETAVAYLVVSKAWMPKGWKLELSEINSESLALALVGKEIFADRKDLPALASKEFYLSDLQGLEAFESETQRSVGYFLELQESGSGNESIQASWWVFKTPQGLLSVPAAAHFIEKVELEKKQIWLRNLKDLP